MGQLKSDGRASQGGWTFPAGVITFGDLYRLNGWNCIAMASIASTDTARVADVEFSSERIWYVKMPSGVAAARGAYLYWAAGGTTFQRGDTNLQATPATAGDAPCAIVEEAKDASNYVGIRVLNVGKVA